MVETVEDGVYIYDEDMNEIVSWTEDEWIEDPSVTIAIANALIVYYTQGPDSLRNFIGR